MQKETSDANILVKFKEPMSFIFTYIADFLEEIFLFEKYVFVNYILLKTNID